MKKKLLILGMVFVIGGLQAAPIPGQPEFSAWKNFNGMYGKIYKDARVFDLTEVCDRVLEWPDFFSEEGVLLYSLEDCEKLSVSNTLSDFTNRHAGKNSDNNVFMNMFKEKYSFESQLWRDEHNLERRLALSSIWNDGDFGDEVRTSPIDLVTLWNKIDLVLFGEKSMKPQFAAFHPSDDDIFMPWVDTPEADEWLDQRAENLSSPDSYPNGEASIVGGLNEQARMFEEELNVHSLIPGRATTQTFDMAFEGKPIPTNTGMHVDTAASAPESPDEPEQITIQSQVPMGELEGVFSKLFHQQSATELRDAQGSDVSRSTVFQRIFTKKPQEDTRSFSEKILSLLRLRAETRAKDGGLVEAQPLFILNTTIDVWIDIISDLRVVNALFLTNPQK